GPAAPPSFPTRRSSDLHGSQRPGELRPVVVLEPVHQEARGAVIFRDRAGTPEDRWVGDGGGREQRLAEVDRERRPEPLAIGPLEDRKSTRLNSSHVKIS